MPGNIPAEKKDYKILNACLCGASYLDLDFKACGAGEGECLCCADDYVCMGTLPDKPQLFGMYGLICYPAFGCCKPVSHFYPEEAALESKKDRIVFGGCCLGPLCAQGAYLMAPRTLCLMEGRMCFVCVEEFAFPPVDTIPKGFGLCGLSCYPKMGCCVPVGEAFEDSMVDGFKEVGGPAACEMTGR